PFDRPVALQHESPIAVVRPRRWLHELDRVLIDARPYGSLAAAAPARIRLVPYQLAPALAMLRPGAARILIADGVGLGQTVQAGIILRELSARDDACRAIVLVPSGLKDQWSSELATAFGLDSVRADAAWLRTSAAERPASINPWSLPGIYIASHDFVKR